MKNQQEKDINSVVNFNKYPLSDSSFIDSCRANINRQGSIIDAGLRFGVLGKKGAWIQHEGELIGQGVAAAQKTLTDKPELADLIVKQIMDKKNGVEPEEEKEEQTEPAETVAKE